MPAEALDEPPKPDEFELVVLGPGVGESVVVHLGDGEWMIVDSCIDRRTRRPAALEYLDAIGVDAKTAVRHVIVTHWHDDHMRGAAEIFKVASAARFYCSVALRQREFVEMVSASRRARIESSGLDEMRAIFDVLVTRAPARARTTATGPEWVGANQCIFRREASPMLPGAEVVTLSPSSSSVSQALNELASLAPTLGTPKRRPPALRANQLAVVVWLRVGNVCALLGSDLETDSDLRCGWSAIVGSDARPPQKAQLIKVPHHGSVNGHEARVWTEMLDCEPIAVVTPFAPQRLPRESDLKRLSALTRELYVTGRPDGQKSKGRANMVERTVRELGVELRAVEGPVRRVRVRADAFAASPDFLVTPAECRYTAA